MSRSMDMERCFIKTKVDMKDIGKMVSVMVLDE